MSEGGIIYKIAECTRLANEYAAIAVSNKPDNGHLAELKERIESLKAEIYKESGRKNDNEEQILQSRDSHL